MNDTKFDTIAERVLSDLLDVIDEKFKDIDSEYSNGILTIRINLKTLIMNKHIASRMIWYSSPISGTQYFSINEDDNIDRASFTENKTKRSVEDVLVSDIEAIHLES